jgi:SpoVK/Ycf46/Vps4 family AAA+-type ATPase
MSENLFLMNQIESFLKAHPRKDGWKVYECHGVLSERLYIGYLLDFLRDRHPDALKHRNAMNEVRGDDMLGTPQKSHDVTPGSEWDFGKELDANRWKGDLEIEWKEQPIHYRRFAVHLEDNQCSNFIATKSNGALRDFHRLLNEYGKMREDPGRTIRVVNGEDIPIPDVSWDDVILPDGQAEEIRRNVEAFFKSRERYQELGVPHRRGLLFTGPPGCGKTLTLKALAKNVEASFVAVMVTAGVEDRDIYKAFRLAHTHSPSVVIFEDMEKLVHSEQVSLAYFLNLLDGLKNLEGVLVIATTNEPELLHPALLHRPSRFDRIWHFRLPDEAQRLALLQKKGKCYFSDEALENVALNSNGFSMAYVQEIIVTALLECAHNGDSPKDDHLLKSLETLKEQRKSSSREQESLADRNDIGFAPRQPARHKPWRRDFLADPNDD